ncbi:MAG: glyoxalase/bleomycin resistance/extradiol dioxygenase family protein [Verrucomicrobia bacterium]|nr:MAG: glyoxalase/bleomycin resistance/extradiol dioxygenase family protein [Verrucomicrobiota bacterium]
MPAPTPPPISRVIETCLYAEDLDAAERFYHDILRLPLAAREAGRHVFFRCGECMLLIFNPRSTAREETHVGGDLIPLHGALGAGHVAFAVTREALPRWQAHLRQAQIPIESHVTWPNGAESLYFRDPAGNSVELVMPELWRDLAD